MSPSYLERASCSRFSINSNYNNTFLQNEQNFTETITFIYHITVRRSVLHADELNAFANQHGVTKISLVFDGARLQAKGSTHSATRQKKDLAYKKAGRFDKQLNRNFATSSDESAIRQLSSMRYAHFAPPSFDDQ